MHAGKESLDNQRHVVDEALGELDARARKLEEEKAKLGKEQIGRAHV